MVEQGISQWRKQLFFFFFFFWLRLTAEGPDHLTSVTSRKRDSNTSDNADFHPSLNSFDVNEVIGATSVSTNNYSQGEPEHIMHGSFEDVPELHEEDGSLGSK